MVDDEQGRTLGPGAGAGVGGDDAELLRHAAALADAVEAALPGWVVRCVVDRCAAAGVPVDDALRSRAADAAERCRDEVAPRVRRLLAADPDEQASTPLAILRGAVRYPTEVLVAIGVPGVPRDDFTVQAFPDDPYDLSPASFAALDPSLQEPGLTWGAAKAYVFLRRRRAASGGPG